MNAAQILARTVREGDCLVWQGAIQSRGYGSVGDGNGRTILTHRAVYEELVGPIPDGMTIDHVASRGCRTKRCVNVLHMEPVTRGENSRRAAVKSHCIMGHPLSGDNLSIVVNSVDGYERRVCKACRRRYASERKARVTA
mgnify:CR=1 FL=1